MSHNKTMGNTWTTTFDATTYQVAVPDGGGLAMKKNCASRTSPISGKCRRFEGQDLVERVALRALIDRLLDYHVPERCEEGPLTWIHMPSATGGGTLPSYGVSRCPSPLLLGQMAASDSHPGGQRATPPILVVGDIVGLIAFRYGNGHLNATVSVRCGVK